MSIESQVIAAVAKVSHHDEASIKPEHKLLYDLGIFLEAADDLFYELTVINPKLPTDLDLTRYFVHTSPHPRRLTNLFYRAMNKVVGTKFEQIQKLDDQDLTVLDIIRSTKEGRWTFDQ